MGSYLAYGPKIYPKAHENPSDVAPCGAYTPWIFFINGVLCFLKFNGSGMDKEKDDWRHHFNEKMSLEEAHHHRKPWIRA